ncbi:uncharacterized protein LOC121529938 [Drosophila eugracilis]|uniref:uncharacterized protein LOC121529938 n=1 Tax=Drosophila eugracilis TaxID=29029 RepID=UPI001BDB450B|nr:uncharacterized protein LOC121529938 [Drosophila eugracilis]
MYSVNSASRVLRWFIACYSSLLASKSRVTPTRALTIPGTELSGAVLAVKVHGGAQLILAYTRQRFWIVTGRQTERKCVQCFRAQPSASPQLMGELKAARLRGIGFYKGYITVFISLATKAVHLEAVTGLATEYFLLALGRFTGRRVMVRLLYSDNGTNFVGADNLMKKFYGKLHEDYDQLIAYKLASLRTTWHFNPPQSPNFGGLWEAKVMLGNHHLKRVIADRRLTYEEWATVLISVEECLNSQPLCPLTADADDLEVLTPAPSEFRPQSKSFAEHFLVQQAMRPKWFRKTEGLQRDDLVIIKDDRFPPSQWLLGASLSYTRGRIRCFGL